MKKFLCLFGLVFLEIHSYGQAPAAAPVRSETYFVVDEQCRAEQYKECLRGASFRMTGAFGQSLACPAEYVQTQSGNEAPPGAGIRLPYIVCEVDASRPPTIRSILADSAIYDRAVKCSGLAASAALAAGAPQCLRRVDTQRLIDTMEVDIKMLLRQMCEADNGKECDKIYAPPARK